jgi:hypothetical protein
MHGIWLEWDSVVSSGFLVSSTNKTGLHDSTEILLKVALNTITLIQLFQRKRIPDNINILYFF